jgi:diadenosine tetraphosphate (Ap4A) HIT family hydrolase
VLFASMPADTPGSRKKKAKSAWVVPRKKGRKRRRSSGDVQDRNACVICRQAMPNDTLTELESSWVTVSENAPLRGYACLVFRRHAVELHDLSESEGAAFMRDIQRLSAALHLVTGAAKLNYEVHGNTIRHLHMHFYPRHPGDAFQGGPINPRAATGPVYGTGEVVEYRARLLEALNASSVGF